MIRYGRWSQERYRRGRGPAGLWFAVVTHLLLTAAVATAADVDRGGPLSLRLDPIHRNHPPIFEGARIGPYRLLSGPFLEGAGETETVNIRIDLERSLVVV